MRVITGLFQPDLESAFIEKLKAAPPRPGAPVAVVAPSRAMADRLSRLVCLEHGLSFLNIRFHTFFSLALEAVEAAGADGSSLIGDGLFHDMIVDRLLSARGKKISRGLAAAYRSSLRRTMNLKNGRDRSRCPLEALITSD